jgi:hypothetical protein
MTLAKTKQKLSIENYQHKLGLLLFLPKSEILLKKKLHYLKIQIRTIQDWKKENLKKSTVFSKILNTKT